MPASLPESRIVGLLRDALQSELLAVYLFGSHARGEPAAGSDIDLAVLVAGRSIPSACGDWARHWRRSLTATSI